MGLDFESWRLGIDKVSQAGGTLPTGIVVGLSAWRRSINIAVKKGMSFQLTNFYT